jgi:hypothetical protein
MIDTKTFMARPDSFDIVVTMNAAANEEPFIRYRDCHLDKPGIEPLFRKPLTARATKFLSKKRSIVPDSEPFTTDNGELQ